jgi:hypothetical protein
MRAMFTPDDELEIAGLQLEIARALCPNFDRLNPDEKWRALVDLMVDNPAMGLEARRLSAPKKGRGRKRNHDSASIARAFQKYVSADPERKNKGRVPLIEGGFREQYEKKFPRLKRLTAGRIENIIIEGEKLARGEDALREYAQIQAMRAYLEK